ncbi:MAG: DUF373 family protein [Methanomassiliicoccales archaeon]|uniref:DUF373 family protein n=1 Tax=Candidatus Methanarcanum hacksteinii TaxID=2911857 RepID=UPI0015ABDF95|nr:DUF373 family protein [Candidatus Methanomethylophilaceae archaeon]MCI6025541.1 DUF373 family protein [Methanomassiliicoccales archaeon]MDY4581058.1 DUF373 family protein [Candidatus Methanarcanum hacksteinii]MDD7479207.1 DUF373 family protein [Methanomassiliicoccales archaeon]MDO5838225.1 DUF373 family protein [Methanomassiliicoccales archaeon]
MTKTLILVVDRDDDFGEKGGVETPVIGIEAAKVAAMSLGVEDPEDSDVNALFAAMNIYNDLIKDNDDVEIALICGDKKVGHRSDSMLISELETVIDIVKPEHAILVGDGAEDEYIYPIISSRVPIDSVRKVYVKQAPGVEGFIYIISKTLRDPQKKKRFLAPIGILFCFIALVYILADISAFVATNSVSYLFSMTAPMVVFLIGGLTLIYAYDAVDITYGYIDLIRGELKSPSITLTFKILSAVLFLTAVVIALFSIKDVLNNGILFVTMEFLSSFLWPFAFSMFLNYMGQTINDYVETKELPYGLITTIVTIMGFSFIVQGVVDFLKNYMGYGTVDVFVVLVEFLIGVVSIIASSVFTVIRKNSSVEEIADEI